MSSAQILSVKYNENNVPYIGLGKHELRLESEPPNEAIMEKARTELRELPEIVDPAIAELREMFKSKCDKFSRYDRLLTWKRILLDEQRKFPNKKTRWLSNPAITEKKIQSELLRISWKRNQMRASIILWRLTREIFYPIKMHIGICKWYN